MSLFIFKPGKTKKQTLSRICFVLFSFSAAILQGQNTNSFLLTKTGFIPQNPSAGNFFFQWVAANNTSKAGNFFILENIPSQYEINSVAAENSTLPSPALNPSLPLAGPASLTLGPFPIAANSSITFQVTGILRGGSSQGQNQSTAGESFFLLSDSQMSAKSKSQTAGSSLENAENPAARGLIQSLVAAPNISNGEEPVNFLLNLNSPAQVDLTLYNIAGEKVFSIQTREAQGKSSIPWDIQNNAGGRVASGLYIYYLKAEGEGSTQTRTGKVLIIH